MAEFDTTFNKLIKYTTIPTNPCLSLFSQLVFKDSVLPYYQLDILLQLSWLQNPLTTLKIIFNSWGVLEKENFYASASWLYKNHPKTLASNVETLEKFGYLTEIVEILCRVVQISKKFSQEVVIMRKEKETDKELRSLIIGATNKARNNLYEYDEKYRFLEDKITSLFVKLLKSDLAYIRSGESENISLAERVLYSNLTATVILCPRIADKLYPREKYKGKPEEYERWVINKLKKKVFGPLSEAFCDPEEVLSARNETRFVSKFDMDLGEDGEMNPEFAIRGKLYEELVIYD